MTKQFRRAKYACYATNLCMSVVGGLPGVLFLTFRNLYDLSYALLGFLVVINFFTQLVVDLIFSFFSHKFNMEKTVKLTPVLTMAGLVLYAIAPLLFPNAAYVGLLLGTVVFSASSGLGEVLISPVIAAIPAENPEREMSKLHSVFAWGTVGVVLVSTLYLFAFGGEAWQGLVLLMLTVPLFATLLFLGTGLPPMETPERVSDVVTLMKKPGLWFCIAAIFLGGAAECTMSQWSSSYIEQALGLPKVWGDICGVALFAMMLGLGRTLYSKFGSHVNRVLLLGAVGATVCYLVAVVAPVPLMGLAACGLTGFCVSMLWPGNLIMAADRFPKGGVFLYAMMAAGGDLGGSVGPQLVGMVTDWVIASPNGASTAATFGLTVEQLGMKAGMLTAAVFPLLGIGVYLVLMGGARRVFNKNS